MTIPIAYQTIALTAVGALLVIVLASSMWFLRSRSWLRWWHIGTRVFSVVLLAMTLLVSVPKLKAVLIGFGTELPGISVLVIEISDFAITLFPWLSVLGLMAVSGEIALLEVLLHQSKDHASQTPKRAACLSFFVSCGIALIVLFCGVGTLMSFVKISNDLL